MKGKTIQKFTFQNAQYRVEDAHGALLLTIDYHGNAFEIEQDAKASQTLIAEAIEVAYDLLSRKHGKNFAERVR